MVERNTRNDSGQALVESAIVLPLLLFVSLCLFQLMLIAHARVMLEYAAFNAVRAGVVHNGDRGAMRNAALISLLPAYGPTNNLENLALTYGKAKLWTMIGEVAEGVEQGIRVYVRDELGFSLPNLPAIGVVDVWPTNPTAEDFSNRAEIDLDLPTQNSGLSSEEALRLTRLTAITTWLFELKVPVANRLVFYSWFLMNFLHMKLQGDYLDPRTLGGLTPEAMAKTVPIPLDPRGNGGQGVFADILAQFIYFPVLGALADLETPHFFMPLSASYSMPAESNLFKTYFQ